MTNDNDNIILTRKQEQQKRLDDRVRAITDQQLAQLEARRLRDEARRQQAERERVSLQLTKEKIGTWTEIVPKKYFQEYSEQANGGLYIKSERLDYNDYAKVLSVGPAPPERWGRRKTS